MTLQELAQHDGRNGRKAYIAVNNKVYDVTHSPLWSGGDHQGAHQAGCDLTEELKSAPHVRAVIDRFPVVAELTTTEPAAGRGKLFAVLAVLAVLVALSVYLAR